MSPDGRLVVPPTVTRKVTTGRPSPESIAFGVETVRNPLTTLERLHETLIRVEGEGSWVEKVHTVLRPFVQEYSLRPVDDVSAWAELHERFVKQATVGTVKLTDEQRSVLDGGWSWSSSTPLLNLETVRRFLVDTRGESTETSTDSQFQYLASGFENDAWSDTVNDVVLKRSKSFDRSEQLFQVMNTIRGQQVTPRCGRLRSPELTVYSVDGEYVTVQQKVDGTPFEGKLTRQEITWLILSGHDDIAPENILEDSDGNLWCIDTCGTVYDDVDVSFFPEGLEPIEG